MVLLFDKGSNVLTVDMADDDENKTSYYYIIGMSIHPS